MIAAILIHRLVRSIDLSNEWYASASMDGTRTLLVTFSASMFTFFVFVFSILLLSVQLASAQLTPRIIVFFYRNPVLKYSLTFFVFTFAFTLAVLFRLADRVPLISIYIAVYCCLACIGVFLYMIDHVGKSLRPISLTNLIGNKGQKVLLEVYPNSFLKADDLENNTGTNQNWAGLFFG